MGTDLISIPNSSAGWASILAMVTMGIFSLISLIERLFSARKKDQDAADDRLINILKDTVKELEEKVGLMETQQKKNSADVLKLQGQNEFMKEILQGRDKGTVDYQRRGLETMSLVNEISQLVVENGKKASAILKACENTNKNMTRLTAAIEKHLKVMEKQTVGGGVTS